MNENDRMLRAEDVAGILQLSLASIWAKARSGELPHVRIGRLIRFRPEVIAAVCRGEQASSPAGRGGEAA